MVLVAGFTDANLIFSLSEFSATVKACVAAADAAPVAPPRAGVV